MEGVQVAASSQSRFDQGTRAYIETYAGAKVSHGDTGLTKASINDMFVSSEFHLIMGRPVTYHIRQAQQDIEPQIQSNNASPASAQGQNSGMFATNSTLAAIGSECGTWRMATSPPRLFMTPRELSGSTREISDESSVGTRASSGAFSLISGDDERLTATDNPVRIPRSVAAIPENPVWSDPNPSGVRYYQCPDVSPTPAGRSGLLGRAPSLISRLNFADQCYTGEDARSSKSPSSVSDVTDVQSQVMSLVDAASSTGMYPGPSPAPSANDVTMKPRLRRRAPVAAGNEIVTQHCTPTQAFQKPHGAHYQQGLPTSLGSGQIGNMAYLGVNMTEIGGYQSPYPVMATRLPALGSPIIMTGPSPSPFHPGTAFGSGNPTAGLPAPSSSMEAQSPLLTKLLGGFGGGSIATKLLDAEYFPFVETAREGGGPVKNGVIKFTNVSKTKKSRTSAIANRKLSGSVRDRPK